MGRGFVLDSVTGAGDDEDADASALDVVSPLDVDWWRCFLLTRGVSGGLAGVEGTTGSSAASTRSNAICTFRLLRLLEFGGMNRPRDIRCRRDLALVRRDGVHHIRIKLECFAKGTDWAISMWTTSCGRYVPRWPPVTAATEPH